MKCCCWIVLTVILCGCTLIEKNTLAICMVLPLLLREEQPDTYFFPINHHAIIIQSHCIRLSFNENKDLPESSTKERRKTGWFGVISRSLECQQAFFVLLSVR